MTIPLYLSVATIGLNFLFPTSSSDKQQASSSSRSSFGSIASSNTSSSSGGNRSFGFGIAKPIFVSFLTVIGGALSWLISSELRRRRVPERLRLAFFTFISTTNDNDDEGESPKKKNHRKPGPIKDIEGTPLRSRVVVDGDGDSAVNEDDVDDGCRRTLVSPNNALTSALNVAVLEIPPGKELALREAQGVECYYIIQGDGVCVIGEEDEDNTNESNTICTGDIFVVDPGSTRSLANTGRRLLTIIRATDVTLDSSVDGIDLIRNYANNQSTILGRITNELSKINSLTVASALGIEKSSSSSST